VSAYYQIWHQPSVSMSYPQSRQKPDNFGQTDPNTYEWAPKPRGRKGRFKIAILGSDLCPNMPGSSVLSGSLSVRNTQQYLLSARFRLQKLTSPQTMHSPSYLTSTKENSSIITSHPRNRGTHVHVQCEPDSRPEELVSWSTRRLCNRCHGLLLTNISPIYHRDEKDQYCGVPLGTRL
jgi:hypothetical protein